MSYSSGSRKSFSVDVTKLVSGTVIAQIIGLCLTPIITRIFNPEVYGLASTFISISTILLCVSGLQYEQCILLPKNDDDSTALAYAASVILLLFNAILFIILLLFGKELTAVFGLSNLYPLILIAPLYIFISNFYSILRQWNSRKKRYTAQATTQVLQTLADQGSRLSLGLAGCVTSASLILSTILGQTLSLIFLLIHTFRYDLTTLRTGLSLQKMWSNVVRYKKFPLISTWAALLNVISWNLPVLMLSGFFSTAIAGLYSLGFTIIQIPISLIGNSVSQVFKQRASVALYDHTLPKLVEDITSLMILLCFIPFAMLGIIGSDIFGMFFGNEWYEAGIYAQILSPFGCLMFISTVLTVLILILEIQEVELIMNLILLPLRFISLLVGALAGNIYLALGLYCISSLAGFGYLSYKAVRKSRASLIQIFKTVRWIIPFWGGIVILMILLKLVIPYAWILFGIGAIIGVLYYVCLLKYSDIIREYLGFRGECT